METESISWASREPHPQSSNPRTIPGDDGSVPQAGGGGQMGQLSLKDGRNIPRRRLPGCGEIALLRREQGVTGRGRR